MGGLSPWHLIILVIIPLLVGIPIGRILKRAGFNPWWALLYLVPLVNFIGLWAFAFMKWPRDTSDGAKVF